MFYIALQLVIYLVVTCTFISIIRNTLQCNDVGVEQVHEVLHSCCGTHGHWIVRGDGDGARVFVRMLVVSGR